MNPPGFLRDTLAQISTASPWTLLLTKVTLLLAAAWVVHFSLARANPRWRTLLWRGTVAGLVLLAVWTLGLPGLEIRIPAPEPVAAAVAPSPLPIVVEPEPAIPAVAAAEAVSSPAPVETPATVHQTAAEVRPETARALGSSMPPLSWRMVLLGIWGLGAALLVVRLAIAYVKLARLLQNSAVASEAIIFEVGRIAAALGCRRPVQVRSLGREKGTGPICRNGPRPTFGRCPAAHKLDLSPFPARQYAVPFLYGLRRPILVLPERMCQPAYGEQLPGIIAHELAHVGSWDFAWNAALQAASTLLWFHPLAWRIGSAHRAACDSVCDAISASYLGDVQAYCRTLARVALEGAGSFPAAALAMARTCDVRRRIAVLQQRVFAAALRRRTVAGVALVGLLSLALLAGVRFALAEPAQSEANGIGRVVDAQGRGIAGATLKQDKSAWTATTDANGSFPLPKLKPREMVSLTISALGFLTRCRTPFAQETSDGFAIPNVGTFELLRPATLTGRVLGPDGKPLAGARSRLIPASITPVPAEAAQPATTGVC